MHVLLTNFYSYCYNGDTNVSNNFPRLYVLAIDVDCPIFIVFSSIILIVLLEFESNFDSVVFVCP